MQSLYVVREVGQVTGYLHAQLTGGAEDKELSLTALYIGPLDGRDSVRGCLAGAGLCQSHHIAASLLEEIGYHCFLDRHGVLESKLFDRFEYRARHSQFLE